jgi:hypothetical protein
MIKTIAFALLLGVLAVLAVAVGAVGYVAVGLILMEQSL